MHMEEPIAELLYCQPILSSWCRCMFKMLANSSTKIHLKHTADKPNYLPNYLETHRTNCPKAWEDKGTAVVILLKRRKQKEIEAEESQWWTGDMKKLKQRRNAWIKKCDGSGCWHRIVCACVAKTRLARSYRGGKSTLFSHFPRAPHKPRKMGAI